MKIGFVGLGHMGSAMASRLLDAGNELVGYDRTRAKAEALADRGAKVADTPRDAARDVEVLVSMLSDDAAVEAVVLGEDGAITTLPRGSVHVSTSTISPAMSARLARTHADRGQAYVAAPVLGRPDVAARGDLIVVAAGESGAIERCRPILHVLGREVRVVAETPEKANVIKLGVNFVLAALLEALGEAYTLVEGHGVRAQLFLDVLSSLLRSPVVDSYGAKIAEQSFLPAGFTVALGAKDLRFALEAAAAHGAAMPLAGVLRDRFIAAIAEGKAESDWSAVGRAITPPAA
jgi:3-hydroxyisobutyrate dehydrogenase-like beta-hydroxyacid dehydrogenase